ncbi:hypothetical protein GCL60_15520 [Silvanigrella paludirubra]|jgi:hypothetical protein|uniref:Uncharacterized protein n=1 Tax=Silvanigrella paludirubra TaxID=2499159 RepID=A0A6N6VUG8_9BACT|nr:hypothetical protein [Silvanigrella paludirubra]KAB8036532.1 hypothetical protein GCL60_15520 [Silvanigrella paludirubra]
MSNFYAGVVRKKFTLMCVSPEGSQIEIVSCYDDNAAKVSKQASEKILSLMEESFELEEGFKMKIVETMESAEDIPLVEVKDKKEASF